jgi:hypothetical protein
VKELTDAWIPHEAAISRFSEKWERPVIFTEYGYMSVDHCTSEPWASGDNRRNEMNETAQANALKAVHLTFMDKPYWAGSFLWKWFPNMRGGEGYNNRDYTPQGKMAEEVLRAVFN